jgi:hypothetical protein
MYRTVNLLALNGKDEEIYAKNVAKALWTKEEIIKHFSDELKKENARPRFTEKLDLEKLSLLKGYFYFYLF